MARPVSCLSPAVLLASEVSASCSDVKMASPLLHSFSEMQLQRFKHFHLVMGEKYSLKFFNAEKISVDNLQNETASLLRFLLSRGQK